ncbi:MAG: pilus assembly protein TadG-related protein [bacterium]
MPLFISYRNRKRSGQAMIFIIAVLVIILFLVVWNFDLHKILSVKFVSQNAGDAAALSAARWQAISLNLVGDLNIMQAVAIMDSLSGSGRPDAAETISELQAHLCFAGPMTGLMACQQAAKDNDLHDNEEFTAFLRNHVSTIRTEYPSFIAEPYPGCLDDYANMLEAVCDNGIAAGPDNTVMYNDYIGDHMLLNRDFYDAIATRDWCWFFFNAYELLSTYSGHEDWPPLPRTSNPRPINCEFFSLHLSKSSHRLDNAVVVDLMNVMKEDRDLPGVAIDAAAIRDISATWYGFDGQWDQTFRMADTDFPSAAPVKPQHNYVGADAAVRVTTTPDTRTPGGRRHEIKWTAAAKPFSRLLEDDKPNAYGIVLPSFHDVRLIPVDASSAPWGGSFDLALRRHVEDHVPIYAADGIIGLAPACWYCRQLMTWEDPVFRADGVIWLELNSSLCFVRGGGGGGGSGGGTRRGH